MADFCQIDLSLRVNSLTFGRAMARASNDVRERVAAPLVGRLVPVARCVDNRCPAFWQCPADARANESCVERVGFRDELSSELRGVLASGGSQFFTFAVSRLRERLSVFIVSCMLVSAVATPPSPFDVGGLFGVTFV